MRLTLLALSLLISHPFISNVAHAGDSVKTTLQLSQGNLSQGKLSQGQLSSGLIIGGEDASEGEFPYMVSLQQTAYRTWAVGEARWSDWIEWNRPSDLEEHNCGATLISPTKLLTAGHCVYRADSQGTLIQRQYEAIIGRTTLSDSLVGQTIDVVGYTLPTIYSPYDYTETSITGNVDVAVLTLAEPASDAEKIPLLGLSHNNLNYQGPWDPTIIGWGVSNLAAPAVTDTLQKGQAAPLSPCAAGNAPLICSQDQTAGDPVVCSGDSGGPVLVKVPGSKYKGLQQVGINSGSNCQTLGIYTSLHVNKSFIECASDVPVALVQLVPQQSRMMDLQFEQATLFCQNITTELSTEP